MYLLQSNNAIISFLCFLRAEKKIVVYLKHIVKTKHSQLFICVQLSKRGSLSAIAWKVRAQSDLRMSRNRSLCCCRGSGGHSWPPARAEEGDRGGSSSLGPGSVLRDHHTPSLCPAPCMFFPVGCLWWKKSERNSKEFLKPSGCFSVAGMLVVGLGQIRCIFLGTVHSLVGFRQISFTAKLYLFFPSFM